MIGDSFIEGSGYDYEYTLAGLLSSKLGNKYEILNSAVESYSPSIYFKKIEHFISLGYKFDDFPTRLNWDAWPGKAGGLQGAVEMCNNNAACRKLDRGVM